MRAYPNPDAVTYPSTMPPRFPCQITTQDAGPLYPIHKHNAYMDAEGNGNTDVDSAHFHYIRGGRILPDQSDGHTHGVTMLACGPSAPWNVPRDGGMPEGVALGDPIQAIPVTDPYSRLTQAELALRLRVREDDYTKLKKSYVRAAVAATVFGVVAAALGVVLIVRSGD